jgi:hypothetical protein
MNAIQANCRQQFSGDDFGFIAATLADRWSSTAQLAELFTDESARDAALESDRLLKALLESPAPLPVSPRLYFYVLTRHSLPQFERSIADYIANVLATFLDVNKLRAVPGNPDLQADHLSDLLIAQVDAPSERAFLIHAQVGDVSLFLTGIFPEHVQHRARHCGAPDISFYEQVGSSNYRLASDHRQAQSSGLEDVFRTVSDRFTDVRQGLNRLTDRFLHLEPEGTFPA